MSNKLQTPITSELIISKLRDTLNNLNTRLSNNKDSSIAVALSDLNSSFVKFFDGLKDPEFNPELLLDGDVVVSEVYNNNLRSIYNDLNRFYTEISLLGESQIKAYNFSSVLIKDVLNYANFLASTVLDLNILNGYTRGDVIIAGDDFKSLDFIDADVGIASTACEILPNGAGIGLARAGKSSVLDGAKIDIVPLGPSSANNSVNVSPTPGNIERFYEGNYYNYIGSARPEGGRFNIKLLVDAKDETKVEDTTATSEVTPTTTLFVDIGASEEDKKQARLKMIDGNATSFWECEYLFKVPNPIIDDIQDSAIIDDGSSSSGKDIIKDGIVNIDLTEAERLAQQYDTIDRDLLLELVVTLNSPTNVNFVAINPVLFGSQAFPEVEEISTADTNSSEFKLVDGWDRIRFSKTITPEANEFLTSSQLGLTLSPSRSNYLGQGIFPFPVRAAKKVKIKLRVRTPVAAPYERTYVLVRKTTNVDTTITTTTTKGIF